MYVLLRIGLIIMYSIHLKTKQKQTVDMRNMVTTGKLYVKFCKRPHILNIDNDLLLIQFIVNNAYVVNHIYNELQNIL